MIPGAIARVSNCRTKPKRTLVYTIPHSNATRGAISVIALQSIEPVKSAVPLHVNGPRPARSIVTVRVPAIGVPVASADASVNAPSKLP